MPLDAEIDPNGRVFRSSCPRVGEGKSLRHLPALMLVTCKHGGVTGHTGPDTAGIGQSFRLQWQQDPLHVPSAPMAVASGHKRQANKVMATRGKASPAAATTRDRRRQFIKRGFTLKRKAVVEETS